MIRSREDVAANVKLLIVDALMLKRDPETIPADLALFGPDSLGLDSIDALQLVVALEKQFGVSIRDEGQAKQILRSVASIVDHILAHQDDVVT